MQSARVVRPRATFRLIYSMTCTIIEYRVVKLQMFNRICLIRIVKLKERLYKEEKQTIVQYRVQKTSSSCDVASAIAMSLRRSRDELRRPTQRDKLARTVHLHCTLYKLLNFTVQTRFFAVSTFSKRLVFVLEYPSPRATDS